jgi:hypothetical protein
MGIAELGKEMCPALDALLWLSDLARLSREREAEGLR